MTKKSNSETKTKNPNLGALLRDIIWNVVWAVAGAVLALVLKNLSENRQDLLSWVLALEGIAFITVVSIILKVDRYARTSADRVEQALNMIESQRTAASLGIAGIAGKWTDLFGVKTPLGRAFKEQLQNTPNGSTWYIITISPEGVETWRDEIVNAIVERGINVKLVHHSLDSLKNAAIQAEWQMLISRIDKWQERSGDKGHEHLEAGMKWMRTRIIEVVGNRIQQISNSPRVQVGTFEVYESHVPHYYMAFLSVPDSITTSVHDQAPPGTYGFIHLYPMFPDNYDSRPVIYLDNCGEILDCYYRAIVRAFREGVYERKYYHLKSRTDQSGTRFFADKAHSTKKVRD